MLPPEKKMKTELNAEKVEVFVLSSDSEDDDTCPSPEVIIPPKTHTSRSPEAIVGSQLKESQKSETKLQRASAPKLLAKNFREQKDDELLERGPTKLLTQRSWRQKGTGHLQMAKQKKVYTSKAPPIVPPLQIKREEEEGEIRKKKGKAGEVKHGLRQIRQKKKAQRPGSFQHFDKVSKVLKIFKDKEGTLYALCEWQNSPVFYYHNNTKHFNRTASIVPLTNVPDYQLTPFITYLLKSVEFRGELDERNM